MSSADGETTSSGGYRIPSLTGQDNYKTWRIQMRSVLFESDLVGYIEKPLTEHLNATTDEKEQQKHKKHDQRALGQMQMRCSAWALTFIENAATAREAWETFRKNFQATSVSSKIFIKKEFYSTKLGDNDDIDEHIHKLRHLYQDLRITGFILPESEFTSVILMSLPPSWDTFVTSIDAKDLDNPNKEISKNAAESILGCFHSEVICRKSQQITSEWKQPKMDSAAFLLISLFGLSRSLASMEVTNVSQDGGSDMRMTEVNSDSGRINPVILRS